MPSSAFLGPVYTGIKTGSVYQTSLSYSSSKIISKIDLEKSVDKFNTKENFNKNPILPDIPHTENNPKILLSYKVNNVEISEIIEPEPLP